LIDGEAGRTAMNVAIVKLSSLGDVVHALPVAAALRARLPHGRVTWVAERREAALLWGNAAIDDVAIADTRGWRRWRGLKTGMRAALDMWMVFRQLRARRFDVALDLQGNIKSGLLTAATGAAIRIGFGARYCREPLNALFTNHRIEPPAAARHIVDQHLALLGALGIVAPSASFWLPSDPTAAEAMERFFAGHGLKAGDRVVALNPGAGKDAKRWPAARFAELARRLRAEVGATVLVVWGPKEVSRAQAIVEAARIAGAILAPPTDLHALLALLRRVRVMVAGDTGPLHLAAALGLACVGLYGPTDPVRNGPYGPGHRIVCGSGGSMQMLPVEPVLSAVAALLD
jgi:lipopolysaccharide heptosyltransferase I